LKSLGGAWRALRSIHHWGFFNIQRLLWYRFLNCVSWSVSDGLPSTHRLNERYYLMDALSPSTRNPFCYFGLIEKSINDLRSFKPSNS
jgi:hypothetical protein